MEFCSGKKSGIFFPLFLEIPPGSGIFSAGGIFWRNYSTFFSFSGLFPSGIYPISTRPKVEFDSTTILVFLKLLSKWNTISGIFVVEFDFVLQTL